LLNVIWMDIYIYIYIIWKSTPLQRGQTLSG
jgi:hypothetical protein